MATQDITARYLNQDKRYTEAVVVTVPAILSQGGGRSQADPVYVQGGDLLNASVIEEDTIITKAYLNIIEAFPVGAVVAVDIGGNAYFALVDGTVNGMVVSAIEDVHFEAGTSVVGVTITGITGDVLTGKLAVVLDTIHASLNNGQFAS